MNDKDMKWLKATKPCADGLEWCKQFNSLSEAWDACDNPGFMSYAMDAGDTETHYRCLIDFGDGDDIIYWSDPAELSDRNLDYPVPHKEVCDMIRARYGNPFTREEDYPKCETHE